MSEKKKFSPLRIFMLEDKTSKKNSVCLSVRTYVDTITFEGVSGSKQNLVGVFYV